jgi:PEP-CTERM motif
MFERAATLQSGVHGFHSNVARSCTAFLLLDNRRHAVSEHRGSSDLVDLSTRESDQTTLIKVVADSDFPVSSQVRRHRNQENWTVAGPAALAPLVPFRRLHTGAAMRSGGKGTVSLKLLRVLGLAAAVGAGSAAPASADPILVTGNTTFSVDWLYTPTNPDLSGSAIFTISNWSNGGFDLAISDITNTMPTNPDINARLTSFGFGLSPNATSFTNIVNGDVFSWGFSNFPGFQQVDVCGYGGNNCAGGSNGGLNQGQSVLADDIMSISILGNFVNGVTFDPIPVKFQTDIGSFEFDSTVTPVPEPASLALLGSGLALAAGRFRRRTKH